MTQLDLDLDLRFGDEVQTTSIGEPTGELVLDLGDDVAYEVDANGEDEIVVQFWGDPDDEDRDAIDVCSECGADAEYLGDSPTNTHATAIDPNYVELWECPNCGNRWEV